MKKYRIAAWIFAVLLTAALPLNGADAANDAAGFLHRVRTRHLAETSGVLDGLLQYLPRGGKMEEHTCQLVIRLGTAGVQARMSVDGKPGVQLPPAAAAVKDAETASVLARCGIRISDLTMGFLHYDLVRELKPDRVRGVSCRVLELMAPDRSERVQVYIAGEYLFSLKAVFFAADGTEPLRTLEIASFKQQNGLYYAELINLRGPDWRSRVTFNRVQLKLAAPGDPLPSGDVPAQTDVQ